MAPDTLDPSDVLRSVGDDDPMRYVRSGIEAARSGDFERGLIFLAEAYLRLSRATDAKIPPAALSWYGLSLAMHRGRFKEAADFCQLAIDKEFYNSEHYQNLARVWVAGKSRRKAVEAIDRGLAVEPGNGGLLKLRVGLGFRRPPVLTFLHRDHPLNQALGRLRHQMKGPAGKRKK
jgi:tetratricopeptide (TPR) repeat protein